MSRRWRFIAALALLSGGARAQFVLGEESFVVGGDTGFGRPPVGVVVPSPTFDLVAGYTTPNDLSDSLVVNSVSMTLVLACDAQGVSGTNWSCRDGSGAVTLAEAGTGSSPTASISTPFHALDGAERFVIYGATQKRHEAASSTVADLTTEDVVVEYVGKLSGVANAVIFDKGASGTDGWRLLHNAAASSVIFRLRTASANTDLTAAGGATGAWGHFIAFVDRDEATTNGGFAYTNGAAGTGVSMSARTATLTNSSVFAVGAASGSASNAVNVASIRVWKCAACMAGGATNPTQWALIARQRAATAFGVAPTIAAGIATPTVLTRATQAHVDVVDGTTRQIYLASNNAPDRKSTRLNSSHT